MDTSKRAFLAIRTRFYVTSFTQMIMAATAAMLLKFICIAICSKLKSHSPGREWLTISIFNILF
jgi:hypothetical protein